MVTNYFRKDTHASVFKLNTEQIKCFIDSSLRVRRR